MASTAVSQSKIPTEVPQLRRVGATPPVHGGGRSLSPRGGARVSGDTRKAMRGDDRVVVEVGGGVTVYPGPWAGDRWRPVWYENGGKSQSADDERRYTGSALGAVWPREHGARDAGQCRRLACALPGRWDFMAAGGIPLSRCCRWCR